MYKTRFQNLLIRYGQEMYGREMYYKFVKRPEDVYTPENDKFRYIFIHIPKTGGLSLLYSLFGEEEILGHRNILQYKYGDSDKFHRYFKFTVVRNPWDRFASSYFFLLKGGITKTDRKWGKENLSIYPDFEEFVLSLKNKRNAMRLLSWTHFRLQVDYISDSNNNVLLDFIGRFEQYEKSYLLLKEKFGVDKPLAHINKGNNVDGYDKLYSSEMREIVGDLYCKDVTTLEYEASY